MSLVLRCSLGDCAVLSGSLVLPLRGNWIAGNLKLRAPDGVEPAALAELSAASLVFTREDGTQDTFVGVVRRSGVEQGAARISATIVGGAGKLLADVVPRHHAAGTAEIPAGLIAKGICDDTGAVGARELLADGVEDSLDAKSVRQWTRFGMPAREALDLLADHLDLDWCVLPSGRVWIGERTWATLEAEKRISPDPDDGAETWACDGAPILPGVTLGGRRVIEVVYRLGGASPRATVRAAVSGDPPRAPLLDLYRASYAATVVSQDTDGLLDLVPDDPRLGDTNRSLLSVSLRVGLPGCKVTVPVDGTCRVRVLFDGAAPTGIYAAPLDQDPDATLALALVGDTVTLGTLSGHADLVTGIVSFVFMPPTGPASIGSPVTLSGFVEGPGHKYVKGVVGP
jgi:hypothetical protein